MEISHKPNCARNVLLIAAAIVAPMVTLGLMAEYWDAITNLFNTTGSMITFAWEAYIIDRPVWFWLCWFAEFGCMLYVAWCACDVDNGGALKGRKPLYAFWGCGFFALCLYLSFGSFATISRFQVVAYIFSVFVAFGVAVAFFCFQDARAQQEGAERKDPNGIET